MKTRLILLLIILLPLFASAQVDYSMQSPIRDPSTGMPMSRPNTPKLETVRPISTLTRVEKAQAKLAREERKLIKLVHEEREKEADLKSKKEKLRNLENTPENNRDSSYQKNIETAKNRVAKSQEELDNVRVKIELGSKKVEDLEKAVEETKFTRHGN